jgi:hypothetical protein
MRKIFNEGHFLSMLNRFDTSAAILTLLVLKIFCNQN